MELMNCSEIKMLYVHTVESAYSTEMCLNNFSAFTVTSTSSWKTAPAGTKQPRYSCHWDRWATEQGKHTENTTEQLRVHVTCNDSKHSVTYLLWCIEKTDSC